VDFVGAVLAFIAILFFVITLILSTRPGRDGLKHGENKRPDDSDIVVRLPRGAGLPDEYTIDLKVSCLKGRKEIEEGFEHRYIREWKKTGTGWMNIYRM